MSSQIELRAEVSEELSDFLEAHFHECGTADWGILQRAPGSPYELFGFFPDKQTADTALDTLRAIFPQLPEQFVDRRISDEEWQNAYKEFVKPWSHRHLHWIPLWERKNIQPPKEAAVVYLDAGMAFGTGSHETTRLCAQRLLDFQASHSAAFAQARIVDAGCGSGVLAFSASAMGGSNILAFDNDPEAISVCQTNLEENEHLDAPQFAVADLQDGLAGEQADLLLANIQADVLLPHSDPVVLAVRAGGSLALSGILTKELDQVRAHYESRFAALRPGMIQSVDSRTDGEWADLWIELN
ncbi:MAG: hypothetical protein CNE95_07145 [Puniceicoccaceae bacterium MED-G30]|nr:MAG: hypothetical protein CNE95_07145 [Puniceicoccaceae bacterium MED-G30]RPG85838.1 MAG: methyltransferase domain-containing protein [Coraliomargarita sp. TMED73]|tara:strand:+ start:1821 stop:2717 length:897 start_codon:yes stop_codon:yes gene_type:complete